MFEFITSFGRFHPRVNYRGVFGKFLASDAKAVRLRSAYSEYMVGDKKSMRLRQSDAHYIVSDERSINIRYMSGNYLTTDPQHLLFSGVALHYLVEDEVTSGLQAALGIVAKVAPAPLLLQASFARVAKASMTERGGLISNIGSRAMDTHGLISLASHVGAVGVTMDSSIVDVGGLVGNTGSLGVDAGQSSGLVSNTGSIGYQDVYEPTMGIFTHDGLVAFQTELFVMPEPEPEPETPA